MTDMSFSPPLENDSEIRLFPMLREETSRVEGLISPRFPVAADKQRPLQSEAKESEENPPAGQYPTNVRMSGKVMWFDDDKGYGFIQCIDERAVVRPCFGKDFFAHFESIEGDGWKSLKDEELVEFLLRSEWNEEEGKLKYRAEEITG